MNRYEVQLKDIPAVICDVQTVEEAVHEIRTLERDDMKCGAWENGQYIIYDRELGLIISNAGYKNNYYRESFIFVDDINSICFDENSSMPDELNSEYVLKVRKGPVFETFDEVKKIADIVWNHLTSEEREKRKFFFIGTCKSYRDEAKPHQFHIQPKKIVYDDKSGVETFLTPDVK